MNPVDHVVADQAIKAKKAAQGAQAADLRAGRRAASAPSNSNRAATIIIWLLGIGTLVAMFLRR